MTVFRVFWAIFWVIFRGQKTVKKQRFLGLQIFEHQTHEKNHEKWSKKRYTVFEKFF